MSEEKLYTIEDTEVEGKRMRVVLGKEHGNYLFQVSADFTDSQVDQCFNVANKYFGDGIRYGVTGVQNDLKRLLGIPPQQVEQPVAVAEEVVDDSGEIELELDEDAPQVDLDLSESVIGELLK